MKTFLANDPVFRCQCDKCRALPEAPGIEQILLDKLNKIGFHMADYHTMDIDLRINSGRRCVEHNATIPGSAPDSQHLFGMAVDIATTGYHELLPSEVADAIMNGAQIENIPFKELSPHHIHLDMRPLARPRTIIGGG